MPAPPAGALAFDPSGAAGGGALPPFAMMNALLPGDEDELMHDVSLFGEVPAGHRHVLKRFIIGCPKAAPDELLVP